MSMSLCRLYAMFRMVECIKSELKSMKHGLYNVIPMELLSGITAEVGGPRALHHLGSHIPSVYTYFNHYAISLSAGLSVAAVRWIREHHNEYAKVLLPISTFSLWFQKYCSKI